MLAWRPARDTPVGSYVMRLTVEANGGRRVYGGRRPVSPDRASAPVVRVLGVEAAFTQRSYRAEGADGAPRARGHAVAHAHVPPGRATAPIRGSETTRSTGLPMGDPMHGRLDGQALDPRRRSPCRSGATGRAASTPRGSRPRTDASASRRSSSAPRRRATAGVAVVLPTNTWQAYNLYDSDGDGWGDTWYAGGTPPVVLDRPYRDRGVPPRFRRYDFPFLRWLEKTRREPDVFADDDLEAIATGDDCGGSTTSSSSRATRST